MGLLGSLFGSPRRRSYGFGRGRSGVFGGGRRRQSTGFFSNPLARIAMGTLGALGARKYMNRRRAVPGAY